MSSSHSYRDPKSLSGEYYDHFGGIQGQDPDRGESKRRAVSTTNNDSIGTPAIVGGNAIKTRWQPPKRSSNAATRDVIMSDRGHHPGDKSKKSHHSKARKPSKHGAPTSRVAKKKVVVSPDSSTSTATEISEDVHKLNPSIDVHARRIHQRRRQVNFGKKGSSCALLLLLPRVLTNICNEGKNTIGYEEYTKQVPKHRRKPRCPDNPQTPDYTLDIPARRWQVCMFCRCKLLWAPTVNSNNFQSPPLAIREC